MTNFLILSSKLVKKKSQTFSMEDSDIIQKFSSFLNSERARDMMDRVSKSIFSESKVSEFSKTYAILGHEFKKSKIRFCGHGGQDVA